MLSSEEAVVVKLSKPQRELLIVHVRDDMRPFSPDPEEARTRSALLARDLIRWVPEQKSRVGCPDGTVLTEKGREAVCMVLGWYIDALVMATERRESFAVMPLERQATLYQLLAESVPYWRREAAAQTKINHDRGRPAS